MEFKFLNGLTPSQKEILLQRLKIEWIYSSNAIEGNTLSVSDTQFILEVGLTVSGKSIKEHNEVVGHKRALDLIYEILEKDSLSETDFFTLHKAIQTEIIIDTERPIGDKKVGDKWERFYYPSPEDTPYLMGLWFDNFSEFSKTLTLEDALKQYIDMHISFISIHPFFDGNGRLARLVSNLPLLRNGYFPLIVYNEVKREYLDLLFTYNGALNLDGDSEELIVANDAYRDLYRFFEREYVKSLEILEDVKKLK